VVARGQEIDGVIVARLAEGWKLERLDRAMRAILRAGTYELLARPDVTVGTVIDEYLDVAHAFFDEKEVKFVNGLLDKVAKDVRG
jgi:N utilization substance protein B